MTRSIARGFIVRTGFIWLALRVLSAAVAGSVWTPQAMLIATFGTVFLVLVDAQLRHERLFLANLGTGRRQIATLSLLAILSLEATLGVIAKVGFAG